ncbi:phosphatase [Ktedonobacter sp. SOSP1-52]|uniref:PHP domain-containing protein n=1 Tax=Ktedonobacter sp. SOSP1-52 TaxID=2778366 RepID=UPI0019167B2B|nr:PHP domain-containing protein [Ktedonobacter sp. SOSP1-52]GHO69044.1 phosphatase [Ktedonobacter sp. SOSP1-52]
MATHNLVLSPEAAVDLHMHTTYSDGRWPAEQLINYLVEEKFDLVAVTDHDRVDKVAEIRELAASKGLPVLPGVEITCKWNGYMAHMLCYGFDPAQNAVQEVTEKVARLQLENTHQVHDALVSKGYAFPRETEVLAEHGGKLFRPSDNITLLIEHGYAPDRMTGLRMIEQAGFVSIMADMAEAVEAAHKSNAVCLIAHPGRKESGFTFYDTELLDRLRAEIPLDGIEVYHPYHSPETIAMYEEYVHKHNLLQSTGSDSHSHPARMPRKHRAEVSRRLLERLGVTINV